MAFSQTQRQPKIHMDSQRPPNSQNSSEQVGIRLDALHSLHLGFIAEGVGDQNSMIHKQNRNLDPWNRADSPSSPWVCGTKIWRGQEWPFLPRDEVWLTPLIKIYLEWTKKLKCKTWSCKATRRKHRNNKNLLDIVLGRVFEKDTKTQASKAKNKPATKDL